MPRPPKNAASDASSAAGRTPRGAKAQMRATGMSTAQPRNSRGTSMASSPELEPPRVVAPDEGDILIEQLEYLLDHVEAAGAQCACSECQRYARARAVLMEIFARSEEHTSELQSLRQLV